MNKAQLRKDALVKRQKAASPALSAAICREAIKSKLFQDAKTIMIYFAAKSEVDTAYLLAAAHALGKTVCAPRVISDTEMEAAIINNKGFRKGAFGIWEPLGNIPSSIDLIYVPGVVFDNSGNRIGYGKGYYDRFLRKQSAIAAGLAYACQIVPEIPAAAHDIRLNMIFTEEGILA